ncbi:disease resistance-like protein DSC1 [Hibiscus syriacus]|uniref:disease resistance-like protein DSC1 n=1 Tax=Hibiscus syriacus TaxID=106335 RepID=UPI0019231751|nr:disease resistance-like protein DSC1 [Hibiscus syriacus]
MQRRTNLKALMLRSLSGLSSLRELKLKDCNLGEEDIPSDISRLSSLERLDLTGNNFISIPPSLTRLSKLESLRLSNCGMCNIGELDIPNDVSYLSSLAHLNLSGNNFISIHPSLTRLSKLQHLELSNCKELKSLPEFVTNITLVEMENCASLELVAFPSKVCNSMNIACILRTHCYRLAENVNVLKLLRKFLMAFENSRGIFDIDVPGNEIPEGFSRERVDCSIKIPLPFNILNDIQWMGVAFCCIFVNDDPSRDEVNGCKAVIHRRNSGKAACDESAFLDGNYIVDDSGFLLGKKHNQPIKKDHLFLRYWSRHQLYPSPFEDKCDESCVKIEDMNEDSAADGSIANGPLGKKKRNIYEGTEAGPQPKRMENIQFSNGSTREETLIPVEE